MRAGKICCELRDHPLHRVLVMSFVRGDESCHALVIGIAFRLPFHLLDPGDFRLDLYNPRRLVRVRQLVVGLHLHQVAVGLELADGDELAIG